MMSGYERRNWKVFRSCWKVCSVYALATLSGSEFQMEEAPRRQPEKLGCRRYTVWQTAQSSGWWRLNGASFGQERRQRVWAVPGIAARYREELGRPAWRPCIVCTPGRAANEGWLAHRLCDRSASGRRSAVPPRSAPTGVGARGRLGCRPARTNTSLYSQTVNFRSMQNRSYVK